MTYKAARFKKFWFFSYSSSSTQPRTSPERTYEILGHTSWPKEASRRANANCLKRTSLPLFAEFSRASERGRRRVQNFIKDAKGMCKKMTRIGREQSALDIFTHSVKWRRTKLAKEIFSRRLGVSAQDEHDFFLNQLHAATKPRLASSLMKRRMISPPWGDMVRN